MHGGGDILKIREKSASYPELFCFVLCWVGVCGATRVKERRKIREEASARKRLAEYEFEMAAGQKKTKKLSLHLEPLRRINISKFEIKVTKFDF